jgi:hypothetical protein
MVRDPGYMADEEALQFQGDQRPAVLGVKWHC